MMTQSEYPEITLYIDGEWVPGAGGRGDDVVNPATEEVIGRVPFAEPSQVDAAIAAGQRTTLTGIVATIIER